MINQRATYGLEIVELLSKRSVLFFIREEIRRKVTMFMNKRLEIYLKNVSNIRKFHYYDYFEIFYKSLTSIIFFKLIIILLSNTRNLFAITLWEN